MTNQTDVELSVTAGTEQLLSKKLDWVGPGEMVKFKLNKESLKSLVNTEYRILNIEINPK